MARNSKQDPVTQLPTVVSKPMARTTAGLRDALFDEIDAMRNGEGDRRRAITVANLAAQIINTVKIEIDYHRQLALAGKANDAPIGQLAPLRLGKTSDTSTK